MRCIVCSEPMSQSERDSGHSVCEVCFPRDHTRQAMERIWGPKCHTPDQDCILCRAWRFFEAKGLVPATEDAL